MAGDATAANPSRETQGGTGELGLYVLSAAGAASLALLNGLAAMVLAFGPVLLRPRLIVIVAGAGFFAGVGLAVLGLAAALQLALYQSGIAEFRLRRLVLLAGAETFPSLFAMKEVDELGRLLEEEQRLGLRLLPLRVQIRLALIASSIASVASLLIACLGLR